MDFLVNFLIFKLNFQILIEWVFLTAKIIYFLSSLRFLIHELYFWWNLQRLRFYLGSSPVNIRFNLNIFIFNINDYFNMAFSLNEFFDCLNIFFKVFFFIFFIRLLIIFWLLILLNKLNWNLFYAFRIANYLFLT